MSSVQIEPHYLGSLEYYALLSQFDQIIFNVSTVFQKQTYRNRAYLLGSNRILILSIPVIASSQTVYKDVKIDYGQNWLKDHWGAFYSSYGKAPFFDYLKQDFHEVWFSKPKFLVDLVVKMHDVIGNILGELPKYRLQSDGEVDNVDVYMDILNPKEDFSERKIYKSREYGQLFGNSFVPNLSIVDLLLNKGSESSSILHESKHTLE